MCPLLDLSGAESYEGVSVLIVKCVFNVLFFFFKKTPLIFISCSGRPMVDIVQGGGKSNLYKKRDNGSIVSVTFRPSVQPTLVPGK